MGPMSITVEQPLAAADADLDEIGVNASPEPDFQTVLGRRLVRRSFFRGVLGAATVASLGSALPGSHPALAAGNTVVLKPSEIVCLSVLEFFREVADLLPPGVVNIVNGLGTEAGKPLAENPRIAKIAFTGSTEVGKLIMGYAAQNVTNITLELGGKSPNIFFADVAREDDDFFDKALEGFTMFALNQGEICTCPSRALVQESIYDQFIGDAIPRVEAVRQTYLERLEAHRDGLAALARAAGWSFATHRTDRPPQTALLALHGAIAQAPKS